MKGAQLEAQLLFQHSGGQLLELLPTEPEHGLDLLYQFLVLLLVDKHLEGQLQAKLFYVVSYFFKVANGEADAMAQDGLDKFEN